MTVVDASVWVSILSTNEPNHEASRRWLASQSGAGLMIPTLALAEVAGAVARRTGSGSNGRTAVSTVKATPGLRIVSIDSGLGDKAAEIAAIHRLRGADAIYVALARVLASPLATLDRELEERASSVVEVIVPN